MKLKTYKSNTNKLNIQEMHTRARARANMHAHTNKHIFFYLFRFILQSTKGKACSVNI
jgi:hypothetical protein